MRKLNSCRQHSLKAIGATDIIVFLVVTSIIGILIFNVYKKYESNREAEYINKFLRGNAEYAINAISKDLLQSQAYTAGCKEAGLIKPKYGGISEPDSISILAGESSSSEILREDMSSPTSYMVVRLGHSLNINQSLTICDGLDIERFLLKALNNKQDTQTSQIFPEALNREKSLKKAYGKGSTIGFFKMITYTVGKSSDGTPTLFRKVDEGEPKPLAYNIENIKFQYFTSYSSIPMLEPSSLNSIAGVNISVVARSKDPIPNASGVNSLSGFPDNYERLNLSAKLDFIPADTKKIQGLAFRIIDNNNEDFPEIIIEGKN